MSETKTTEKKTNDKKIKKVSKISKISKFFKETITEFTSRVVWPTKKKIINNTSIVLGFMIVFSAFVALIDLGMQKLVELLLR